MKPENRKRLKYIILSIFLTSTYILLAAQYPQWWITRGVINANSPMTNDYAAVTQGQVKWMAKGAYEEMQTNLVGGAGSAISNLISSFSLSNNYLSVNQGQLKNVASKFYDRLIEVGYTNSYPWTTNTIADDNDYAAANIGQLKYLFSFDIVSSGTEGDSDGDGLPDAWEIANFGNLNQTANGDYDNDGLTNLTEYQNNTDPDNNDITSPSIAFYYPKNNTERIALP